MVKWGLWWTTGYSAKSKGKSKPSRSLERRKHLVTLQVSLWTEGDNKILQDQPKGNTAYGVQQWLVTACLPSMHSANKFFLAVGPSYTLSKRMYENLWGDPLLFQGVLYYTWTLELTSSGFLWVCLVCQSTTVTLNVLFTPPLVPNWDIVDLSPPFPSLKYFSCLPRYPRRKHTECNARGVSKVPCCPTCLKFGQWIKRCNCEELSGV